MNKKGALWLLVLLIIVIAKFAIGKLIMFSWVSRFITLEQIQAHSMAFKHSVGEHYFVAVLIYIGIYALTIAVGIPGVVPLSLLGGYLFGVLLGTVYGAFGATVGSVVAFVIVRYVLKNWVKRRYGSHVEGFNKQMRQYGANYLLMVHYASIIPFFFINSLAAISDVGWWTFIWTTIVGFIPLAVIYAFAGRELATIESVNDILSPPIIAVFVILIFIAFLPILIKYYKGEQGSGE
jgi:Uncharacterized conserved protein